MHLLFGDKWAHPACKYLICTWNVLFRRIVNWHSKCCICCAWLGCSAAGSRRNVSTQWYRAKLTARWWVHQLCQQRSCELEEWGSKHRLLRLNMWLCAQRFATLNIFADKGLAFGFLREAFEAMPSKQVWRVLCQERWWKGELWGKWEDLAGNCLVVRVRERACVNPHEGGVLEYTDGHASCS